MKREIKFKAKRLDNNTWVEGSLVNTPFGTFILWYEDSICNKREVDTDTVCQSTGLTDCEGKEIWEGDVLFNTNSGSQYTVMYSDYGGAFFIRKKGTVNDDMYLFELSDIDKCIAFLEVIGNKFDK